MRIVDDSFRGNAFIEPTFTETYRSSPIRLVDVGASGGLTRSWKPAEKYLELIGFEPDERSYDCLEQKTMPGRTYLNKFLFEKKGSEVMYLLRKQEVSGMFCPNREFLDQFPNSRRFDVIDKIVVETDTLDNQMKRLHVNDVDFIKLDTEGCDLSILKGATETIKWVFGLEIEVSFNEIRLGQPLFSDIDPFVRSLGFQLFHLDCNYWRRSAGKNYGKSRGQISAANAIYLRELKSFKQVIDRFADQRSRKGKVIRGISICMLYGCSDYALEITHRNRELFNDKEYCSIVSASKNTISTLRKVLRRLRITRLLHSFGIVK